MKNKSTILLGCSLISGINILHAQPKPDENPNIIFILTDDQRWDALGYAGNTIVETPEMDRLARQGSYFKNAFVTTPISAASRATIFTGMHERTHGYTFQQGEIKQSYIDHSYPAIMRDSGYYTGFFGKFGVEYKNVDALFDVTEVYDRLGKFKDRRGYFHKSIGNDTVHLTRYTGWKAMDFIENVPDNRPFCLSISFSAPHAHDPAPDQYFWQEKSDNLYEEITIPPPPLIGDQYFDSLPREVKEGYNRTRWYWRYDTAEKYQQSMKGYYRMITEIDEEIGAIRRLLEQKGVAENTVIIVMGDNGYFEGERQLAGKWLMYDNSIHVPLIVFDPREQSHHEIDDMVLNIDIPSTILDVAGVKPPSSFQGFSLMPYVRNGHYDGKREAILIEHLWEIPEIPSSEGIRTERWKYFRYRFIDTPEELYDLHKDPMEMNNLATDPNFQSVLDMLRKKLKFKSNKYYNAKMASDFTLSEKINMGF